MNFNLAQLSPDLVAWGPWLRPLAMAAWGVCAYQLARRWMERPATGTGEAGAQRLTAMATDLGRTSLQLLGWNAERLAGFGPWTGGRWTWP